MWKVHWTPRALKDLQKLDPPIRQRIAKAVARFAETGAGDIRQLTDVRPPEWRLRVGSWRVRFSKDFSKTDLIVLRVLPRAKAY